MQFKCNVNINIILSNSLYQIKRNQARSVGEAHGGRASSAPWLCPLCSEKGAKKNMPRKINLPKMTCPGEEGPQKTEL